MTFNPDVRDLLQHQGPKVVFIHIGKTAGTTIQNTLLRYLSDTKIKLYEYHCHDANLRIAGLSQRLSDIPELSIVVPVRDTLERWISAWNWDCSRLSADYAFVDSWPELKASLSVYKSCPELIDALHKGEPGAELLSNYGHICMGHSWYLPSWIASSLVDSHVNLVAFDRLGQDLLSTLNQVRAGFGYSSILSIDLPREKMDYKSSFLDFPFARVGDLSSAQINFMKDIVLAADYRAIGELGACRA